MNYEQGKAHFLMKPLNPTPRQKEKTLAMIAAQLDRHNEIRFAYCHGSFMEDGPFRDVDIAIFLEPDFLSEINFRYEMQLEAKLEKAINIPAAVDVRILNTAHIASRYLDIAPILKHHTKEAFGFDPGPRPNPG